MLGLGLGLSLGFGCIGGLACSPRYIVCVLKFINTASEKKRTVLVSDAAFRLGLRQGILAAIDGQE